MKRIFPILSAAVLAVGPLRVAAEPLRLADPFVLTDGGRYYAYGTSDSAKGIKVAVSDDLLHWRLGLGKAKDGFALNVDSARLKPPYWAPEVYRRKDGKFVMHVSCCLRICAAMADSPLGPFVSPTGKSIVEFEKNGSPQGTIDSSLFVDDDGRAYLFFVRWNPDEQIWRIELEDDWMTARANTERFVFVTRKDTWETRGGWLNEGPFCVKVGGKYLLTYSAGDYKSAEYAVGAAVADSIDGPWQKPSAPFMHRSFGYEGTGHHSFFRDLSGKWRIVFHAHDEPGRPDPRRTLISDVAFRENDERHAALGDSVVKCETVETCDVCVVGGGSAGITAALSAGRRGVRTVLLEQGCQVGGNTTSGGVNWPGLFHAGSRQVIAGCGWSLVTNVVALAGEKLPDFTKDVGPEHWRKQVRVNIPLFVALAEEELTRARVDLHYQAAPIDAVQVGDGWRLRISEGGEISTLEARVLIDTTGNGALSALCGARRLRDDSARQPGGFTYLIDPRTTSDKLDIAKLERMRQRAIAEGRLERTDICRGIKFLIDESNVVLGGFARGADHGTTIANYIVNADNSTARLRTQTNMRGRASMLRTYRFLKTLPGLESAKLISCSPEVGVRETWRVVGDSLLTGDDYASGRVFPDSIAYSYYPIDIHDAKTGIQPRHLKPGVVPTIPLGALCVAGKRNLLVAGRCISCDRAAHSALRVQASCMATGQVAGETAALAAEMKREIRQVPLASIRARLKDAGAIVVEEK